MLIIFKYVVSSVFYKGFPGVWVTYNSLLV